VVLDKTCKRIHKWLRRHGVVLRTAAHVRHSFCLR